MTLTKDFTTGIHVVLTEEFATFTVLEEVNKPEVFLGLHTPLYCIPWRPHYHKHTYLHSKSLMYGDNNQSGEAGSEDRNDMQLPSFWREFNGLLASCSAKLSDAFFQGLISIAETSNHS